MLALTPGAAAIELRDGSLCEQIPAALVKEAIAALPGDAPVVRTLHGWVVQDMPGRQLSRQDLEATADQLAKLAHGRQGEIGEIGRLPSRAGGRLVGMTSQDDEVTSAATALSLALRRLLLLWSLGGAVVISDRTTGREG